jgi:hypothetical protein
LISAIAETADGELLCHSGLSFDAPDEVVGHAGQALTLPAARGRHIFTSVKQYLVDWATELGLVGMYSEATAAHPYSQQALLKLGGHEVGFMLGFIPDSVDNNAASAASAGRQSAALFFLRMRPGKPRILYAPSRHREILRETVEICGSLSKIAEPSSRADLPSASQLQIESDPGDNVATLTVSQAGKDLTSPTVRAGRRRPLRGSPARPARVGSRERRARGAAPVLLGGLPEQSGRRGRAPAAVPAQCHRMVARRGGGLPPRRRVVGVRHR